MDAGTRRQAELAERVRDFALAHPSEDPAYAGLLERITAASQRARALADAEVAGIENARVTTGKMAEVRRLLVRELLPNVARVAKAAMIAGTDVGTAYINPGENVPVMKLGSVARAALDAAKRDEAILRKHGLSETLIPLLTAAVSRYDVLIVERNTARGSHVGARAGLKAVMREVRAVTDLLNGFNRLRFQPQSTELAEWKRAKTVLGSPRKRDIPPVTDTDVAPAA